MSIVKLDVLALTSDPTGARRPAPGRFRRPHCWWPRRLRHAGNSTTCREARLRPLPGLPAQPARRSWKARPLSPESSHAFSIIDKLCDPHHLGRGDRDGSSKVTSPSATASYGWPVPERPRACSGASARSATPSSCWANAVVCLGHPHAARRRRGRLERTPQHRHDPGADGRADGGGRWDPARRPIRLTPLAWSRRSTCCCTPRSPTSSGACRSGRSWRTLCYDRTGPLGDVLADVLAWEVGAESARVRVPRPRTSSGATCRHWPGPTRCAECWAWPRRARGRGRLTSVAVCLEYPAAPARFIASALFLPNNCIALPRWTPCATLTARGRGHAHRRW